MRRIKFRIWDKKYKKFLYARLESKGWLIKDREIESKEDGILCVWQQYTGLKDKNGKEIYEGDILSFFSKSILDSDFSKFIESIWWDENELCYKVGSKEHNFKPDIETDNNNFEVVGNIYKTPELLEKPVLLEEKNGKN